MRGCRRLLLTVLCLHPMGCGALFDVPLADPKEAKLDADLFGVWHHKSVRNGSVHECLVHIGPGGSQLVPESQDANYGKPGDKDHESAPSPLEGNFMRAVLAWEGEGTIRLESWTFFAVEVDGQQYAQFPLYVAGDATQSAVIDEAGNADPTSVDPGYYFLVCPYSIEGDRLTLQAGSNPSVVAEAVKRGDLRGTFVDGVGYSLLQGTSSDELRRFLESESGAKLFSDEAIVFTRLKQ